VMVLCSKTNNSLFIDAQNGERRCGYPR